MRRALAGVLVGVLVAAAWPALAGDRDLVDQLDREIIALQQKVRRLEGQLHGCAEGAGDPGPIYPELVQVFSGGPVTVERRGTAVLVSFPSDVLFSTGSLTLREEADFALDLLATALKLHPDVQVMLVGHTDDQLPPAPLRKLTPDNWSLSVSRAMVVSDALVRRFAVPARQLTVAGRAEHDPVTGNDTPEGRAQNRRIVAHVTPGVPR